MFTAIRINEPAFVKANFAFTQVNVSHYGRQKVLAVVTTPVFFPYAWTKGVTSTIDIFFRSGLAAFLL